RFASGPAFGGCAVEALPADERWKEATALLPRLRAEASRNTAKISHFDDSAETLEFVNAYDAPRLADIGTSCPDHFLRTKIQPLLIDPARLQSEGDAYLEKAFADYRAGHVAYYERCKSADSPKIRDANPVVILMPGVGQFTLAKDKATARIA